MPKPMTWNLPKFTECAKRLPSNSEIWASREEQLMGILERLWSVVATHSPGPGKVPDFYFANNGQLLHLLTEFVWLDERDGQLFVHDWEEHRPAYLNKRARAQKSAELRSSAQNCAPSDSGSDSVSVSHSPAEQLAAGDGCGTGKTVFPLGDVTQAQIAEHVRDICRRMDYPGGGHDLKWIWKAAALWEAGVIPQFVVMNAAESAGKNARTNPPAYFRKALVKGLKGLGETRTLGQLSKLVMIQPDWPDWHPDNPNP